MQSPDNSCAPGGVCLTGTPSQSGKLSAKPVLRSAKCPGPQGVMINPSSPPRNLKKGINACHLTCSERSSLKYQKQLSTECGSHTSSVLESSKLKCMRCVAVNMLCASLVTCRADHTPPTPALPLNLFSLSLFCETSKEIGHTLCG